MSCETVCDFYCDQVTVLLNTTVDLLPTFIIEGNANFQLEIMKIKISAFLSFKFTNPLRSGLAPEPRPHSPPITPCQPYRVNGYP